jgi:hypothetical protein
MKNKKLNISVLAIVLGSLVAFTQSAFKPAHKQTYATAQWIFTGTMLSQDKSAVNYVKVDATHPVPSNCTGTALPCYITVDGDLQTYLNANSSTAIRDNANEVRN